MNFEDFKQGIRNSIITQQVISREVGSHISIPPDEIAKFYELNKKEFEGPEQVQIAELLISPAKDDKGNPKEDQASLDAAKTKAESVLAEIKKGLKFSEATAKYSDGQTAQPGWQHGVDVKHPVRRIRLETQDRLQHGEDRSGGPSLRHVGTQILDWEVGRVPMKAGVELG